LAAGFQTAYHTLQFLIVRGAVRRCRSKMCGVWLRVVWRYYNYVRLNGAIGYITPEDMLAGHQQEIQA
jgi:hypothetical protein